MNLVNTLQHSVIHRLPQRYHWCAGPVGQVIEAQAVNGLNGEDELIGLRLLSHNGESAWETMQKIESALAEIQLPCSVAEWEGEPCLFVHRDDECAATCRLKSFGVGIAEPFLSDRSA